MFSWGMNMMSEVDTEVTLYDMVNDTDYDGNLLSYMLPAVQGSWVSYSEHYDVTMKLKDRIIYLENVCDEQTRMLTGD
jgi:hypothetical protein